MLTTTDMSIIPVDPFNPLPEALDDAAALLAAGLLVVAPTETRYGLLARADSAAALAKLFEVKGRVPLRPTAIFVPSHAALARYGQVTVACGVLAAKFLPGPLTLVLQAQVKGEPPVVVDGKIGLRFSSSAVIARLLERVDFPVTATSANISGSPDLDSAGEINAVFGDQVSLYLDAGELPNATSTVVDCSGPEAAILRQGAVSAEAIRDELRNAGLR